MSPFRGFVQCISLVVLSTQSIFSEIIRFNDGAITYEYDNSSTPLGVGSFGTVYEGIRTEGNQSESVAFKEFRESHKKLLKESNISAVLGQHDLFPNFYRYFPETSETRAVFVMERIGKTMYNLWNEFRPFSTITVMQIGLQILDAVEWMHGIGISHNDLHAGNIAIGYHNKSKIYLFDFSMSEMSRSPSSGDLSFLSQTLNEFTLANLFDEANDCNTLVEFDHVVNNYIRTSDDGLRDETFSKLRSMLMRELESHKNDADYEKYADIGYIQDDVDGINLLRKLIKQNDTTAIENLLQSDHELNTNAGYGNSSYYKPIHLAAEFGNARAVQLFMGRGAEVNTKYNQTYYAMTPLHYAAMNGHVDVVKILLEHGAEVTAKILNGRTPFHFAASNGHVEVVRFFCERGASISIRDNHGRTPLHFAATRDNIDVIRVLIENGAEIDAKNNDGNTPLYCATQSGSKKVVGFLIENGADVNANYGKAPLHYAAMHGKIELVRFLCYHGAQINIKCSEGKTPLHYATRNGYANIVRFLIDHGANINAVDNSGKTPIHFAVLNGKLELFQFFCQNGAKIDVKCNEGKTPLYYAAEHGREDFVRILIELGADITVVDNSGKKPLEISIENDYNEIVKMLREAEPKSTE